MATIDEHIEKSYKRLCESEYQIENIWQSKSYDWPGDWEGRALLAFVSLYKVTGKKIECMDKIIDLLPEHLNELGYMGKIYGKDKIDEQQHSAHSWLIRGLCEYYRVFGDERALKYAENIVKNLFLSREALYDKYPVIRTPDNNGDVSGNLIDEINGWKLSSDVGCAYMCIDGLSDYYSITHDADVKEMLDSLIAHFMNTDRVKLKCQTHATLSAVRGMLRLYDVTGDKSYLKGSVDVFELYTNCGMTLTYENFNWFERIDTWTEPCCVVDSFIIASKLYKITGEKKYLTLLRRIWFNGLSFAHRANGGAGPNKCTHIGQRVLNIRQYEAAFCCSMRYCEGLVFVKENEKLLSFDRTKAVETDEYSRRFVDDVLIVKDKIGNDHFLCDLAFPENDNEIEYEI